MKFTVAIRKLILFSIVIPTAGILIGWVFWKQELQYALPTPVPVNFVDVKARTKVDLVREIPATGGKPTLLHFFNFDCACSRFNMRDFESMAKQFGNDVNFYVVIQSEDESDQDRFNKKYDLDIPTILDKDGSISDKCGIYATPQGVLLDKDYTIYFKGNYNLARYCTKRETKFAELAIGHLLKNEPLPLALQYALKEPFGCQLPSDDVATVQGSTFSLF
jgi:peroxiredoxin